MLASREAATLIAGGTDLGVEWNLHGLRWSHLISLEAIDELRAFSEDAESVMLGAALACVLTLPFSLPFSASPRDIALLALLGIFQIAVPCMLLVVATRSLLAPEVALLWLLETVLGPLWAWLGAGEVPSAATLAGGALVLAALAGNELAALGSRARAAYR